MQFGLGLGEEELAERLSNYRARIARHEEIVALPAFAAMVGIGRISELFSHLPRGLLKRLLPRLAATLQEHELRWTLDELRDLRADMMSRVEQLGRLEKKLRQALQEERDERAA